MSTTTRTKRVRVLVTRPTDQAEPLKASLQQHGYSPVVMPLIQLKPVGRKEERIAEIKQMQRFDWLILTSANAVHFFLQEVEEIAAQIPPDTRIAVVGKKTEKALQSYTKCVDLIPETYTAESLLETLSAQVKSGERVLFPKSAKARPVIPEGLTRLGVEVVEMPLYTPVINDTWRHDLLDMVEKNQLDLLTFFSPSVVRAFHSLVSDTHLEKEALSIPSVCIGPITKQEAFKRRFTNVYEAKPHTLDGLISLILKLTKHT